MLLTTYYNLRKKAIVEIFNLLRFARNDNFLYLPIVNYLHFEMAPKKIQTVDFLKTLQINFGVWC